MAIKKQTNSVIFSQCDSGLACAGCPMVIINWLAKLSFGYSSFHNEEVRFEESESIVAVLSC